LVCPVVSESVSESIFLGVLVGVCRVVMPLRRVKNKYSFGGRGGCVGWCVIRLCRVGV
jgi:hypothetical protein